MRHIGYLVIALAGLVPNGVIADGAAENGGKQAESVELSPAAVALLDEFGSASRRQLSDEVPALAYTDTFSATLSSLELRKTSAVERLSEVRRLSLLTLAEIGQAQLFFGVNSDGTLGLHFGAKSQKQTDSAVRTMALPYMSTGPGL